MNKIIPPWQIIKIELTENITDLLPANIDPQYQVLYTVFYWHNIPFGHQEIPRQNLPLTIKQVTALAIQTIVPNLNAHLADHDLPTIPTPFPDNLQAIAPYMEQLERKWAEPNAQKVSVVICTRDRPEHIENCLRSLEKLVPVADEIVVVDNAPTTEATKEIVAKFPTVKYVLEPRPGLDHARNAGIHNSTGEIIAYTDDDVIVHPQWIQYLRQSFAYDPQIMAVTGIVLAAELATESQLIFEKYWSFNRGYAPIMYDQKFFQDNLSAGVPVCQIGAGANMAFRREIFTKAGDFDPRLDVGASGCNGDSEYWYRVLANGGICRYDPKVVTYHFHRTEMAGLTKQLYFYMRGHVSALCVQFERHHHWGNLRRLFIHVPLWYGKLYMQGILAGFQGRYQTLLPETFGYLSGIKYYWQNRVKSP
jgi:glycosyltransferase involved in cell wall biosynthesis